MPKKFATENTKASAAKARKEGKKEEDQTRKQKEAEEAYWKDDDKKASKKRQKKDDEEQKRQEHLQKKAETKSLLDKEMSNIASTSKMAAPPPTKITRAQIEKAKEANASADVGVGTKAKIVVVQDDVPLEENLNRLTMEQGARSVDEAIAMLGGASDADGDAHPERRMRAAFAAYQERRLPELKIEYPSMRFGQLKLKTFKEWQHAPENPMRSNKE